jgi:hypothetical protein
MSTLLERMIQRTQAPLSSLEPLSRPHFSDRPAQPLWAHSASEGTDTAPEDSGITGASNPLPPPLSRPQSPRAELARISHADTAAGLAARPRPAEAEPPTAPPRAGLKPQVRTAPARHDGPEPAHAPPQPTGHRGPDTIQTPPEPAATDHRRPDTVGTPPEPTAAAPDRHVGSSVPVDPPGPEIHTRAARATAQPEAMPAVTPLPVPARLVPERRTRALDGSGESPAAQQSTADTGGGRPDVTICIGHIEVRAAPPTEPPRPRLPFRPRVSLDDFLTQRQDRRR